MHVIHGFADVVSGKYEEAVAHGRRGVELDPKSYLAQWVLMEALSNGGHYAEAAKRAESPLAISGNHIWALSGLARVYAQWGKPEAAKRVFAECEERERREHTQPAMLAHAPYAAVDQNRRIAYSA